MICDYPYIKIPKKYKLGVVPSLNSNRLVFVCPQCNKDLFEHHVYSSSLIGFYNFNGMAVPVHQCPFCFTTWWNHANIDSIETQLSLLKRI